MGDDSTKKRKSELAIDSQHVKKKKTVKGTVIETMDISSDDSNPLTVAVMPFAVGEVIWGKLHGWPFWPAKILAINNQRIEVEWFNDYRTTKLFKSQICKFYTNYDVFSEKFDSTVGLKVAAMEALEYIASKLNIDVKKFE